MEEVTTTPAKESRRRRGELATVTNSERLVTAVVMGHRPGPARLERQRRLGAIERLALGVFVEAEHRRPLRRIGVQADDVDQLVLEVRIGGQLERVELPRLELV